MASLAAARAKIAELSQRAASERRRAARAAVIAADYEARIDLSPPSLRPLRIRLAALHRQLETRHVVAAQLQEFYASRLDRWACAGEATKGWPTFAVSDATARFAHDVEFVMGEGPAHDVAATFRLLRVGRFELLKRSHRGGHIGLRSDRRRRTAPRPCFRRRSADGDTGASRDRR